MTGLRGHHTDVDLLHIESILNLLNALNAHILNITKFSIDVKPRDESRAFLLGIPHLDLGPMKSTYHILVMSL